MNERSELVGRSKFAGVAAGVQTAAAVCVRRCAARSTVCRKFVSAIAGTRSLTLPPSLDEL